MFTHPAVARAHPFSLVPIGSERHVRREEAA
jgi:hypothetical protein